MSKDVDHDQMPQNDQGLHFLLLILQFLETSQVVSWTCLNFWIRNECSGFTNFSDTQCFKEK